MSDELILQELKTQTALLRQLITALSVSQANTSPNYRRRLGEYPNFDWSSIGATVAAEDAQGVSEVDCLGYRWIRRRSKSDDDFGEAIWFSRAVEVNAQAGIKKYAILIKFADYKVKKIGEDLAERIGPAQARPRQAIKPLDVQRTAQIEKTPTTEQPNDLLSQAEQVQDAPGFYNLVNVLLGQGRKDVMQLVQRLTSEPTGWQEKARALAKA